MISRQLALPLSRVLVQWETETSIGIEVISGHRTPLEQDRLRAQGRPTASNLTSTHLTCPATGADVTILSFVTSLMKARFGRIVIENGLRWGGGSKVDPTTGIPSDWNHVDTGPRV